MTTVLPRGTYLRCRNTRVLASSVPCRPKNDSLSKSSLSELTQEGTAFLGAGHSGKPFRSGKMVRFTHRFL